MKLSKPLIILILIIVIASFSFFFYKEGTYAVNKQDTSTKIFVIKPGEGLNAIVRNLKSEGFIRNPIVFYLVVKKEGLDKKIQAGDFRLSPSMDAFQIANTLTHGTLDEWVTVIEGLRKEEVGEIIAKKLDIPSVEFVKLAPEGYLFPDTYLFPKDASAGAVIDIMTSTFEQRFTPEMQAKAKSLGLSKHDAVVLASLVEREARTDSVRQQVASIMMRRLKEDMPLQVDATVQYALGYQAYEKTWWKKDLTFDDLKIKSVYNTYRNTGLPPEPICNPSASSLTAVANADPSTPYLFYIVDKHGRIHFAKTSEEHQKNIDQYLQ